MGTTTTHSDFEPHDWAQISTDGNTRVLASKQYPSLKIQEHPYKASSEDQYIEASELYKLRKVTPEVVQTVNQDLTADKGCTSTYSGHVYTEWIPITLENMAHIPFPDNLHLYKQALNGADALSHKTGPFEVRESMIGINTSDVAKIYHNSDFAQARPSTRLRNENQMVMSILNTIELNTDTATMPRQEPSFKRYVYGDRNQVSLNEAKHKLQSYAQMYNRGVIPDHLDCVRKVGGAENLRSKWLSQDFASNQHVYQSNGNAYQNGSGYQVNTGYNGLHTSAVGGAVTGSAVHVNGYNQDYYTSNNYHEHSGPVRSFHETSTHHYDTPSYVQPATRVHTENLPPARSYTEVSERSPQFYQSGNQGSLIRSESRTGYFPHREEPVVTSRPDIYTNPSNQAYHLETRALPTRFTGYTSPPPTPFRQENYGILHTEQNSAGILHTTVQPNRFVAKPASTPAYLIGGTTLRSPSNQTNQIVQRPAFSSQQQNTNVNFSHQSTGLSKSFVNGNVSPSQPQRNYFIQQQQQNQVIRERQPVIQQQTGIQQQQKQILVQPAQIARPIQRLTREAGPGLQRQAQNQTIQTTVQQQSQQRTQVQQQQSAQSNPLVILQQASQQPSQIQQQAPQVQQQQQAPQQQQLQIQKAQSLSQGQQLVQQQIVSQQQGTSSQKQISSQQQIASPQAQGQQNITQVQQQYDHNPLLQQLVNKQLPDQRPGVQVQQQQAPTQPQQQAQQQQVQQQQAQQQTQQQQVQQVQQQQAQQVQQQQYNYNPLLQQLVQRQLPDQKPNTQVQQIQQQPQQQPQQPQQQPQQQQQQYNYNPLLHQLVQKQLPDQQPNIQAQQQQQQAQAQNTQVQNFAQQLVQNQFPVQQPQAGPKPDQQSLPYYQQLVQQQFPSQPQPQQRQQQNVSQESANRQQQQVQQQSQFKAQNNGPSWAPMVADTHNFVAGANQFLAGNSLTRAENGQGSQKNLNTQNFPKPVPQHQPIVRQQSLPLAEVTEVKSVQTHQSPKNIVEHSPVNRSPSRGTTGKDIQLQNESMSSIGLSNVQNRTNKDMSQKYFSDLREESIHNTTRNFYTNYVDHDSRIDTNIDTDRKDFGFGKRDSKYKDGGTSEELLEQLRGMGGGTSSYSKKDDYGIGYTTTATKYEEYTTVNGVTTGVSAAAYSFGSNNLSSSPYAKPTYQTESYGFTQGGDYGLDADSKKYDYSSSNRLTSLQNNLGSYNEGRQYGSAKDEQGYRYGGASNANADYYASFQNYSSSNQEYVPTYEHTSSKQYQEYNDLSSGAKIGEYDYAIKSNNLDYGAKDDYDYGVKTQEYNSYTAKQASPQYETKIEREYGSGSKNNYTSSKTEQISSYDRDRERRKLDEGLDMKYSVVEREHNEEEYAVHWDPEILADMQSSSFKSES